MGIFQFLGATKLHIHLNTSQYFLNVLLAWIHPRIIVGVNDLYIYKYVFPKNIYTFHSKLLDLIYETVALYVRCNPCSLTFSQFCYVWFKAS